MKILIKGAGDLATGIASRLHHSGHQVLMTEIAVPLTVRRMAALSRAVYEGVAAVEHMKGICVQSKEEARQVLRTGDIPIIVDEDAAIAEYFKPDVIVDSILAKKNLGSKITDAPFVIAVGPGFEAGMDCHCVVETKRGHTLGQVIYEGSAIPNTGIPGEVGGYSTERLIRAAAEGFLEPLVSIGENVKVGQLVARTGGKEVFAQMSGIVRGMLQPGVTVKENLKIGDIDARSEYAHCFTISDKARAVGGGVLEAVSQFAFTRGRYALVVLAAGKSERFGANKLLAKVGEKALCDYTLERLDAFRGFPTYVVTGYEEVAKRAEALRINVVKNMQPELGISFSMRLGMMHCLEEHADIQGILFSVCDQKDLQTSTIQRILNEAGCHPGQIICARHGDKNGNPVLWDRTFFEELASLSGDKGGKVLFSKFPDQIRYVEVQKRELKDIDYPSDLSE